MADHRVTGYGFDEQESVLVCPDVPVALVLGGNISRASKRRRRRRRRRRRSALISSWKHLEHIETRFIHYESPANVTTLAALYALLSLSLSLSIHTFI